MELQKIKKQFSFNFNKAIEESDYKGMPLESLGKAFGVSATMVHFWRTGQKMPSMKNAIALSMKLAVNLEWLLTNRGNMRIREGIDYVSAMLLSAFDAMETQERMELIRFAAFLADRTGDKLTSMELLGVIQPSTPERRQ